MASRMELSVGTKGMKKRQTYAETRKLVSGDLESLLEKSQHPGSLACFFCLFVFYRELNREMGLLHKMDKEMGVLCTNKQGVRVYGIQYHTVCYIDQWDKSVKFHRSIHVGRGVVSVDRGTISVGESSSGCSYGKSIYGGHFLHTL